MPLFFEAHVEACRTHTWNKVWTPSYQRGPGTTRAAQALADKSKTRGNFRNNRVTVHGRNPQTRIHPFFGTSRGTELCKQDQRNAALRREPYLLHPCCAVWLSRIKSATTCGSRALFLKLDVLKCCTLPKFRHGMFYAPEPYRPTSNVKRFLGAVMQTREPFP